MEPRNGFPRPLRVRRVLKRNLSNFRGYFPKGGGEVEAVIQPITSPLRAVDKTRPGDIVHMSGYSFAAGGLPLNVSCRNFHVIRISIRHLGDVEESPQRFLFLSGGSSHGFRSLGDLETGLPLRSRHPQGEGTRGNLPRLSCRNHFSCGILGRLRSWSRRASTEK